MAFQTQILFEEPGKYKKGEYPYLGASPKFAEFLKSFLLKNCNKIKSVRLALYLFNNYELHKTFLKLAEKKINIDVFSIPLEGYSDSSPQYISPSFDGFEFSGKQTKKSIAKLIIEDLNRSQSDFYKIHVFPHAYIRSSRIKKFSRGKIPYSLHTKSVLIEFKNDQSLMGISSSNLALRDLPKHDYFVLKSIDKLEKDAVNDFFDQLEKYSLPVTKKFEEEISFNFTFKQGKAEFNSNVFFISPFFKNSPEIAERIITKQIKPATKRVWVMAQHISAYFYKVPINFRIKQQTDVIQTRSGFLSALLEKGKQGVDIRCLSQTYVDNSKTTLKFREPSNKYHFRQFIREIKKIPSVKYAVNDNVHSKYIIVDDMVIVTTFNYTPTQFISLPYVNIEKFENIPDLKYKGVFSEAGQMLILRAKNETECFVRNFNYVWNEGETEITIKG